MSAAKYLIAMLDERPGELFRLGTGAASMKQARWFAKYRPERIPDYVAATTQGFGAGSSARERNEAMAAAAELICVPEVYRHQDSIVAILDIGSRLGIEEERKLVRIMLTNLARDNYAGHVETGVGAAMLVVGKHSHYSVIDDLLDPMETFSKNQGLLETLGAERATITEITDRWTRVFDHLLHAGATMDGRTPLSPGSLVQACMRVDEAGDEDEKQQHILPLQVLVRAGADWRAAMEDPRVGESARSLMKELPEVRQGLLSDVAVQKPSRPGALKM